MQDHEIQESYEQNSAAKIMQPLLKAQRFDLGVQDACPSQGLRDHGSAMFESYPSEVLQALGGQPPQEQPLSLLEILRRNSSLSKSQKG